MPRLFVTRQAADQGLPALRAAGWDVALSPDDAALPRGRLLAELGAADAAVVFLTDVCDQDAAEAIGRLGRLRILATCSVGFDHVDVPAFTRQGIWVTNTPGVLTDATAELTWALILAAARRVVPGDRLVRAGAWHGWSPVFHLGTELRGKTLGIVGAGRIGAAVARIGALGFGISVAYTSPNEHPDWHRDFGARRCTLDELLRISDVVSLHAPLTPATRGLIGPAQLALLKPGAIFINTARGALVDEAALVDALRRGTPAAAGLDVFVAEPAGAAAFAGLDNVVLLPHLGSATVETRGRMMDLCVRNILAAWAGKRPENALNDPTPRDR